MKTEKHSTRHRNRRSGLTLVEVIVVAAIIILVIGVAVPGIVSLASLGRGDFGNSSRNLLGALRAAKMYSATYRSITAVAYVYSEVYDSVLFVPAINPPQPQPQPVLVGFALVRKVVDRQEALKLAQGWSDHPDFTGSLTLDEIANYFLQGNLYFTLQNQEGRFREFGRDAVILNLITDNVEMGNALLLPAALRDTIGLSQIAVIDAETWYDADGDDLPDPIPPNSALSNDDPINPILFPAHVFTPTGPMRIGGASPERIVLEVGPSPALSDAYRFGRELTPNEISTTNADEDATKPLAQAEIDAERRFLDPILIELYQSTGRVNMASEGM